LAVPDRPLTCAATSSERLKYQGDYEALALFRTAHLFFIPSLIRLRAAAERRCLLPGPGFLPSRLLVRKAAMAASSRSRSASNSAMIRSVFKSGSNRRDSSRRGPITGSSFEHPCRISLPSIQLPPSVITLK